MFLENKDVINQYLQDNDRATLSINDVHNLNIGKVAITCFKTNNYNNKIVLKREREIVFEKRLVR